MPPRLSLAPSASAGLRLTCSPSTISSSPTAPGIRRSQVGSSRCRHVTSSRGTARSPMSTSTPTIGWHPNWLRQWQRYVAFRRKSARKREFPIPMDQTETPAPGEAPMMRPLGAGDRAPTFMLPDPDNVMISSAELLENGPLVVTFYRGIWCPYCRQDLKDLGNAAPDIRSCGASLVAIAHQTVPDSNGKFQREHGLEFPILDDRQGDVAVAYRIRWSPQELAAAEERLGKLPGLATETTWILPMQARYVIGRDGIIVYADINADYRQHRDPREIVPLLRKMSRAPG